MILNAQTSNTHITNKPFGFIYFLLNRLIDGFYPSLPPSLFLSLCTRTLLTCHINQPICLFILPFCACEFLISMRLKQKFNHPKKYFEQTILRKMLLFLIKTDFSKGIILFEHDHSVNNPFQ